MFCIITSVYDISTDNNYSGNYEYDLQFSLFIPSFPQFSIQLIFVLIMFPFLEIKSIKIKVKVYISFIAEIHSFCVE